MYRVYELWNIGVMFIKEHFTVLRWIATVGLTVSLSFLMLKYTVKYHSSTTNLLTLMTLPIFFYFQIGRPTPKKRYKTYIPLISVSIMLTAVWAYFAKQYGAFEPSAVLFHFNHGIGDIKPKYEILNAVLFFCFGALLIGCISYMSARNRKFALAEKLFALPLLLVNPISLEIYARMTNNTQAVDLTQLYQKPEMVTKGSAPKKNLIWIYMESVEATFGESVFEGAIKDLQHIAKQGLEVRGIHQIRDTGWTIAGQVATMCGIPLMSLGIVAGQKFGGINKFLPGTTCLGDLLAKHGYRTAYSNGAPLSFAGKGTFFRQHGFETVKGLNEIPHDKNYTHLWGVYDDDLFDHVFQQIKTFSQQGQPYAMVTLTNGAHASKGHVARRCKEELKPVSKENILFAVQCTSHLVNLFIEKLRANNLLNNTIVIISSDHLMSRSAMSPSLAKLNRENFFVALGEHIKPQLIEKTSSMLDVFPTILELLGYKLVDQRAGLGVSMISKKKSLLEQIGLEELEKGILYDKDLRSYAWGLNKTQ